MSRRFSKTSRSLVAVTAALALTAAAACGDDDDPTPAASPTSSAAPAASSSAPASASETAAASPSATDTASASPAAGPDTNTCDQWKQYGDITGKSISLYTSIIEPEDQPYKDSYKPFEECTGATIKYEGSKEFEEQVVVRTKAGSPPDVALLPQPGLLKTLVDTGKVMEATPEVKASVEANYDPAWIQYGSVGDKFYAAPNTANVKSFVWYSPKKFAEKGYTVPQTWDELMALSDKIAADDANAKPWCAGFGSGVATGWPGTDWLEDVMLRTAGPDVYDQWVKHEIPFNDPKVAEALARVGTILKNEKYVNGGFGGPETIATTTFNDGGVPITTGECYMHRQASFYANQFPKGTTIGENEDIFAFYFPAIDPAQGKPVLGAGEFTAAFADRPEVKAFTLYLTSATWVNAKAKATVLGGFVSPHKGLDIANVATAVDKLSQQMLLDPKAVFRFDGSDLMPSAVGAGSLWKGMTDWVTGKDDKAMLDAVEASWPK